MTLLFPSHDPTGTEFYQSLSTTASKYRISFDLDITSGTIQTSFSSPSVSTTKSFTTSGSKTVDITTTASFSRFRFVGLGGSVFNIDNVSVVEVTDDTDLPRINYTDGEGSYLVQNVNLTNTRVYKIQFTISDYVSGDVRVRFSGGAGFVSTDYVSGNNTHTLYLQSIGNTVFRFQGQNNFTASIDNVSVKEVGQNWTFGTGWSIEDGKVYFDNPTGTEFYQSLSTTARS